MTSIHHSPQPSRSCLAIVLAAGEGTRMKSGKPKVLHQVANRSMLGHVLAVLAQAGATRMAVVIGPDREDVAKEVSRAAPDAQVFVQRDRLGTAHAVLSAREALGQAPDDVIVAFGDTPLILPETFARLRAPLGEGAAVVAMGFHAKDPTGYGRFITSGDELLAIREHRDASEAERAITLCNGGLMAIRGDLALALLDRVRNDNAKGEYYLTDIVEIARSLGHRTAIAVVPEEEVHGVNDRAQLAAAERMIQDRLRHVAMASGVTLVAPETVFLSYDTRLGQDVVVEPHVVFGPGVVVEDGAVIHSFSHLEGARVASGAGVGPFARLRPGASIGPKAKVGNFVEIKNTDLGAGAKVSHLTYLGDASVGAEANIGAGTITCNYDGFGKYRTEIGEGAFIGSNSSLVAPVTIGKGAFVGSGSVITESIPEDALGLGRGRQIVKEGWAVAFREKAQAAKRK
ncbi:bifunctional UDP-N-acetylglucosamine diphosphorylase/glucosamine-1-phosphate N-acetyltransferase GlmU [Microvirga arsenatis]|uniref:Bifunctional protein GlmU n=1 Tax=Microvirga arsenatis TaxID=2692265 RepID=A0ABW9YZV1_9HYPH|nr:bifunctional UDP-N-acetylglucosamine diphosphorylase/glucosamine-1-phosphate N-acetyltransferase GlmU [Microvirga arsenatis]NBJ12088.1 bifunctional UDP-N-acetylglucosamine diphosphorylase/glucosamine-1-phosphate N-acetyltransferase GlmU [Microvirga arsenatis]NBJ25921.1 bifunctional UDP-N-acetylglucosamine diphosphorylase/glucosamine-1-phosphate N-acetyltransferase GlmU [Microvirga arsenatis]